MRKLASIQRIKALDPIPEADQIQKATVLGWELVVKKGEFQVGDLCVYCEVDSLFPEKPEFEFLKPRGMRIRTIRLRGQISQGICFPLSILPPGTELLEGLDVTEALGIVKYEPPIPACLMGIARGAFPSFIPKTDETRIQVLQDRLNAFAGQHFFITEKLDGSSVTYYHNNGEFGVCSRNLDLLEDPANTQWRLARELDLENKLKNLGGNFAIQGELIGEGIQGNKYGIRGQDVYFFNVFDIDAYAYLHFEDYNQVLEKLGLKSVPVLDSGFALTSDIHTLVEMADGNSLLNNVPREGLVLRPLIEARDIEGRVSFKSINPRFLLKYE